MYRAPDATERLPVKFARNNQRGGSAGTLLGRKERGDLGHDPLGALLQHVAVEAADGLVREGERLTHPDPDARGVRPARPAWEDAVRPGDGDWQQRRAGSDGQQCGPRLALLQVAVAGAGA